MSPITALLAAVTVMTATTTQAVSKDRETYLRANQRLAQAIPLYPNARLVRQESTSGEIVLTSKTIYFEAVLRVSALARPQTQRTMTRFYKRRLGNLWRQQDTACLVSGTRLVVILQNRPKRDLGILVDSRGARRCSALTALLGDLLDS